MGESKQNGTKARPDPLFRVDLKANGGTVAPRSLEELREWAQRELDTWAWLQNVHGHHRNAVDLAVNHLRAARDEAQHGINERDAGRDPAGRIQSALGQITTAFATERLPHSSTALHREVEALRVESPDAALAFLYPQMAQHRQYKFEGTTADAWHGFVLGLFRAHGEPAALRQLKAQREAFDEFLVEAKNLAGERRDEFDRIENDLAAALRRAHDDAEGRALEYSELMKTVKTEHEDALQAHEEELSRLRRVFNEGMALRAPVEYWKGRQTHHRNQAIWFFIAAGVAVAALAVLVAWVLSWAVAASASPSAPDPWRLVVAAVAGAVGIWVVRLVVRMLLSNIHLSTDAAERVTMVQTYLALMESDTPPTEDDRKLILQALFRPGSDGLVKDDALPSPLWEAVTRPRA